MASDIIEPPPSSPHPDDPGDAARRPPSSRSSDRSVPDVPFSGSNDELSAMLAQPSPDPFLGRLDEERPATHPISGPPDTVGPHEKPPPVAPESSSADVVIFDPARAGGQEATPDASGSFEAVGVMFPLDTSPASAPPPVDVEVPVAEGLLDTSPDMPVTTPDAPDPLASLDLSAPAAARLAAARDDEDDDEDDEDEDEPPQRGPSWPVVLLASYASAVTLGLIWVLWQHRSVREADEPEIPAVVDTKADPGVRANRSRQLTPPAPLPADQVTTLRKPIRVGEIEVTPLEITRGRVRLVRTLAEGQSSDGGRDALKLRLRIRNVSRDLVFAPLDEAFLREREAGVFDSLIECSNGQVIDMYPLAVSSEWSIDGQEFRELKPGATLETEVVSAPDTTDRQSPEMTWRVRLRTGLDETAVIGVKFRDSDIGARR